MIKQKSSDQYLDLRGTPCPTNFVRCRLALENVPLGSSLQVDLDKGEPEEMVVLGLKDCGHSVQIIAQESDWITLKIYCGRS